MVGIKFFEDEFFKNSFYAKLGGIPSWEINYLEIELLQLLNFNLFVDHVLFDKYYSELSVSLHQLCLPQAYSQLNPAVSPSQVTNFSGSDKRSAVTAKPLQQALNENSQLLKSFEELSRSYLNSEAYNINYNSINDHYLGINVPADDIIFDFSALKGSSNSTRTQQHVKQQFVQPQRPPIQPAYPPSTPGSYFPQQNNCNINYNMNNSNTVSSSYANHGYASANTYSYAGQRYLESTDSFNPAAGLVPVYLQHKNWFPSNYHVYSTTIGYR